MRFGLSILFAGAILTAVSCGKVQNDPTPPEQEPEIQERIFAEGADISWATQMEGDGQKFFNADGKEMECTALMKETGFDAIRLRVWVDPEDGWCGKDDVLEKARRAQTLGMRIMIDFHYSSSWADPSKQNPPEAWKNHGLKEKAEDVAKHTSDILNTLKDNNIDIEWVQMGNEVNSGMLWPSGKVQGNSAENFTTFINKAYDAVKEIYPEAKTIIHVSNGQDAGLFEWFFNLMRVNNARYDMIGMSLYPCWWENGGWNDWKPVVDKCIANMKALAALFGKPVIICETGMPVNEAEMSRDAVKYILDQTRSMEECHGVFYWEPQTDGVWKPDSYRELGWNAYDKGAFKNGRPTIALDPFKE